MARVGHLGTEDFAAGLVRPEENLHG